MVHGLSLSSQWQCHLRGPTSLPTCSIFHSPPLTHSPACCSAQTPTAIASFWVGAIIVVCSIFLYAWAGNRAKKVKEAEGNYELAPVRLDVEDVGSNSSEEDEK